jgi:hypothetical protein
MNRFRERATSFSGGERVTENDPETASCCFAIKSIPTTTRARDQQGDTWTDGDAPRGSTSRPPSNHRETRTDVIFTVKNNNIVVRDGNSGTGTIFYP